MYISIYTFTFIYKNPRKTQDTNKIVHVVLVSSGSCNKVPHTGWLKNRSFLLQGQGAIFRVTDF